MNILKSTNKALALAVLGTAVLTQMSCKKENPNTDTGIHAEYGNWRVLYYTDFNAGLVGLSADAATMCAYDGTNTNFVYFDMFGTATAEFQKDGSNSWYNRTDGKNVVFENSIPGMREEKGSVKLSRQLITSMGVTYHNVSITAGNEAGINIIPRTDYVSASWDASVGKVRLTMQKARDKRYIRIRTDYNTLAQDPNDGQWYIVVATDLYQIDCGSSARESGQFNRAEVTTEVMAKGVIQSFVAKKNALTESYVQASFTRNAQGDVVADVKKSPELKKSITKLDPGAELSPELRNSKNWISAYSEKSALFRSKVLADEIKQRTQQ